MSQPNQDQVHKVLVATCRVTGVGSYWLRSDCRKPMVARARAFAAIALRRCLGMSWPQIGRAPNRSHSSVIELVDRYRHDESVQRNLAALSETRAFEFSNLEKGAA